MDDFFSFLHLTTIIVTFRNHIDEFFVTMQNNDSNRVREFKIVLLGNGGVGKTQYMERLVTGQFQELYDATIGKQVYSLVASTNRGQIKFKMVDIPGQEKTGLLKQQYYENADGAFIMFDVTCRDTYRGVPGLYKDVKQWYETKYDRDIENFPFVLIGNKVDFTGRDRKVKFESIRFHHDKENNMNYYEMSNKTDFNLEQPFLWMARFLLEDHQLELIGRPVAIDEEEATDADEMDID